MSSAIAEYEKLVAKLSTTNEFFTSQMFGKLCLKIYGKAFVAQHNETVVFKLPEPFHSQALSLVEASEFADAALIYVSRLVK